MQKKQNRIETSCLIFRPFEWFGDPAVMKCTSLVLTIRSPYSAIGCKFFENVSSNGTSFGVPEQIESIACNSAKRWSLFAKNKLIPF